MRVIQLSFGLFAALRVRIVLLRATLDPSSPQVQATKQFRNCMPHERIDAKRI